MRDAGHNAGYFGTGNGTDAGRKTGRGTVAACCLSVSWQTVRRTVARKAGTPQGARQRAQGKPDGARLRRCVRQTGTARRAVAVALMAYRPAECPARSPRAHRVRTRPAAWRTVAACPSGSWQTVRQDRHGRHGRRWRQIGNGKGAARSPRQAGHGTRDNVPRTVAPVTCPAADRNARTLATASRHPSGAADRPAGGGAADCRNATGHTAEDTGTRRQIGTGANPSGARERHGAPLPPRFRRLRPSPSGAPFRTANRPADRTRRAVAVALMADCPAADRDGARAGHFGGLWLCGFRWYLLRPYHR